jgi:ATP synthase protein I
MNEEKKLGSILKETAPYLTLGIQLAITVVVFFFIGKYADEYFGSKPWLMVTAVLIGSAGGMIKFFRTVIELSTKEENERHSKK